MSMVEPGIPQADDRGFMGHPRGLCFLAFNAAWERFSYYGMTALLALYMVNQLLLPGHVGCQGIARLTPALPRRNKRAGLAVITYCRDTLVHNIARGNGLETGAGP